MYGRQLSSSTAPVELCSNRPVKYGDMFRGYEDDRGRGGREMSGWEDEVMDIEEGWWSTVKTEPYMDLEDQSKTWGSHSFHLRLVLVLG